MKLNSDENVRMQFQVPKTITLKGDPSLKFLPPHATRILLSPDIRLRYLPATHAPLLQFPLGLIIATSVRYILASNHLFSLYAWCIGIQQQLEPRCIVRNGNSVRQDVRRPGRRDW
jgi:hypothetical protein